MRGRFFVITWVLCVVLVLIYLHEHAVELACCLMDPEELLHYGLRIDLTNPFCQAIAPYNFYYKNIPATCLKIVDDYQDRIACRKPTFIAEPAIADKAEAYLTTHEHEICVSEFEHKDQPFFHIVLSDRTKAFQTFYENDNR